MKQRRKSTTRRTKSDPKKKTDHEENAGVGTDHLLEEVKETNKRTSDPSERERVIPSRPC